MAEQIETVIIGGGQAGLGMSYYLRQLGREHIILERGRVAERWRSERWDSLTLIGPPSGNADVDRAVAACPTAPGLRWEPGSDQSSEQPWSRKEIAMPSSPWWKWGTSPSEADR